MTTFSLLHLCLIDKVILALLIVAAKYAKKKTADAAYRAAHQEELRARHAAYRAANPEKLRARIAAYNATHPEKAKARKAARYAANPNKMKAQQVIYRATNSEKLRAWHAARRARKAAAPLNDFTAQQWRDLQAFYNYRCVYCPDDCKACRKKTHKLTQDHLTPLGPDGPHTLHNILPACQSCNSKKRRGPVLKPVQPLLL